MARLNVEGNRMMDKLAEDLDVPFVRNGSLVVCIDPAERDGLQQLYDRGVQNGVEGLKILSREEALAIEPNLSDEVCAALYAPTGGIICPFTLNIAMAENAYENGVEFLFDTKAEALKPIQDGWEVRTNHGTFRTKTVVNAAGVYADVFHNMVSAHKLHITPRRGDYCLLDHEMASFVTHTTIQQPTRLGKGVPETPTVHGNLLVGPTAIDIEDREGVATTAEGLAELMEKSTHTVKNLPVSRKTITSFAGLRAHEDGHEFVIGWVEDAPGFLDVAGIESPGLTASPAIGRMVADLFNRRYGLKEKKDFVEKRRGILNPAELSLEERGELIRREPAYGTIICRCESVSEGEILDAIRRPLGARSLDGIKRRTRAGMGRCQAGFCSPRVMEILSRELGIPMEEITKNGGASRIVLGRSKGESDE